MNSGFCHRMPFIVYDKNCQTKNRSSAKLQKHNKTNNFYNLCLKTILKWSHETQYFDSTQKINYKKITETLAVLQ